jgi:TetR/AcrR family transcriptional regulator
LPTAQESTELKRKSIIRAAAQCFNRSGFHGTSMDDIAARLGVTKPALYRYVKNKHEVLFACFTMVMDMSFSHLERWEGAPGTALERLRSILHGYLLDLMGALGHPVVLLEEGSLLPEQLRDLIKRRDELEARYRRLVEEGMRDGSVTPCDAKLAVFAVFGAINWVPKWYREDGEWSAEYVADNLVEQITRGLAASPHVTRADVPAYVPGTQASRE